MSFGGKTRRPKPLGDLVRGILKQYRVGQGAGLRSIQRAWAEAVGVEIAGHTRLAACERGVLTIEVDSAPLLQELAVYLKRDLLTLLRQKVDAPIGDLKFRLGRAGKNES